MTDEVDVTRVIELVMEMCERTHQQVRIDNQQIMHVLVPKDVWVMLLKELEDKFDYVWHDLREDDEAQDS